MADGGWLIAAGGWLVMAAVDTTRLCGDGVDERGLERAPGGGQKRVLGRVGEDARRGPSGRKVG